jgi:hypothetical protein
MDSSLSTLVFESFCPKRTHQTVNRGMILLIVRTNKYSNLLNYHLADFENFRKLLLTLTECINLSSCCLLMTYRCCLLPSISASPSSTAAAFGNYTDNTAVNNVIRTRWIVRRHWCCGQSQALSTTTIASHSFICLRPVVHTCCHQVDLLTTESSSTCPMDLR